MTNKGLFLASYKKTGSRLIPPAKQIKGLVEFSYYDEILPEIIWISSIFLNFPPKIASDAIIEFITICQNFNNNSKIPPLCYLSSFRLINEHDLPIIYSELIKKPKTLSVIISALSHHNTIFHDYPLKFIFLNSKSKSIEENDINKLSREVEHLLDRYSNHATIVQTAAFVSMSASGKMVYNSKIEFPDFNSIFTSPKSDEAKKVASFVRAGLNSHYRFSFGNSNAKEWTNSFWSQSYKLSDCK